MLVGSTEFPHSQGMATVHIIGAGISGLAAATLLASHHIPVKLYEATAHAGGRCRSSRQSGREYDHGLHLVSPTDKELHCYLERIGQPGALVRVAALPLPSAPLADYMPLLGQWFRPRGRATQGLARDSVLHDAWLKPLARLFYATPENALPARALRRYPRRRRTAMARDSLQATYIQPALDYLERCGGSVYFSHALSRIEPATHLPGALVFARKKIPLAPGDMVVLATPPAFTRTILPSLPVPSQEQPSITLHFDCPHREAAHSVAYLIDAPMDLLRYGEGSIAAAIRLAAHCWPSDPELLAHRVWRAIQARHSYLRETPMPPYHAWREKRAGHAVSEAPPVAFDHGRIVLAGDWLDPTRPASLEQAAAHGRRAAELAMRRLQDHSPHQQHFYLN